MVHSVLQKALYDYNLNPNKEPQVNLAKPLLEMRKHRLGLIQTEEQYLFCWLSVRDGVQPIAQDIEFRRQTGNTEKKPTGHYVSLSGIQEQLKHPKNSKTFFTSFFFL